MPPEQMALAFEKLELSWQAIPANLRIEGVAALPLSADFRYCPSAMISSYRVLGISTPLATLRLRAA